MEVYMNSSQVKDLITIQTNIEWEPFDNYVPETKHVDLFLFDDHLLQLLLDHRQEETVCLHETTLLWHRPDWGSTIPEMLKYNGHVHLFDQRWYCVQYNPDSHYFKFKPCDTPNLVAPDTAVSYQPALSC